MPLNPSNTLRAIRIPSNNGGKSRAAGTIDPNLRKRPSSTSAHHHNQHHGAEPSSGSLNASERHWFDKYHKLLEEHMQVKHERKEQDQRLTEITTKFRKITRDLKLQGFNEDEASDAAGDIAAPYMREIAQLKDRLAQVTAERDSARADAAELRRLMGMRPTGTAAAGGSRGHSSSQPGTPAAGFGGGGGGGIVDVTSLVNKQRAVAATQSDDVNKLRAALQDEISKNERLSQHCEHLRAQLSAATSTTATNRAPLAPTPNQTPSRALTVGNTVAGGGASAEECRRLRDEVNSLNARVAEYKNTLDTTQRDKAALEQEVFALRKVQVRTQSPNRFGPTDSQQQQQQQQQGGVPTVASSSIQQHYAAAPVHQTMGNNGGANTGASAASLQLLTHDLTAKVTTLSQRLDHSQTQIGTLKSECERLLQELKQAHVEVGEARKRTFEAEQESSTLRVKAARTEELESSLKLKSDELLRCEQELLRLVDKLQSCSRETESQIRLEYTARLADVDTLREEAERNRRSRERELFNSNQDLAEVKRDLASKTAEVEHLQREVARVQKQNEELLESKHQARTQSTRDATDAQLVQEAVASVMTNNSAAASVHSATAGPTGINGAAGVFDATTSNWNEKWELQQLREQSAQAILDREISEQRAADFELAVTRKNDLIQSMMEERDQLLMENLELRRRLNGVQTCFTRTIESQEKQLNDASASLSSITVILTGVHLTGFPGLHIASIEGIVGFECGVSDPFAVMADGTPTGPNIEIPFRFSGVPHDSQTVSALREAFFNLQIHQVKDGSKSALVAIGRVPAGAALAGCLETGSTTSTIELLGGDGSAIGGTNFTTNVDNAALPLALLPPIDAKSSSGLRLGFSSSSADPDAMRSLLLAMRAVRGVRIQILKCTGLHNSSDPNRMPLPYVFYTASLDKGQSDWPLAHVIGDTAVHTRTRAVTNDPVFDVEPKDFLFRVFDDQVAAFFRHAMLSFVVYDVNCERPEEHLGLTSVSLAPMLESPSTSLIQTDLPLHPHGTISFTISWIR